MRNEEDEEEDDETNLTKRRYEKDKGQPVISSTRSREKFAATTIREGFFHSRVG